MKKYLVLIVVWGVLAVGLPLGVFGCVGNGSASGEGARIAGELEGLEVTVQRINTFTAFSYINGYGGDGREITGERDFTVTLNDVRVLQAPEDGRQGEIIASISNPFYIIDKEQMSFTIIQNALGEWSVQQNESVTARPSMPFNMDYLYYQGTEIVYFSEPQNGRHTRETFRIPFDRENVTRIEIIDVLSESDFVKIITIAVTLTDGTRLRNTADIEYRPHTLDNSADNWRVSYRSREFSSIFRR